jgi:uncharacterized protein with FMN-binding domain
LDTGNGVIVRFALEVATLHVPFPVELSVRTIDPALISAADGVYDGFSTNAFGEKTPVPVLVHCPPPAWSTDPFNWNPATSAQTLPAPEFTIGEGVIFRVRGSLTALQVPLPVDVNVKITECAVVSAAEGRYAAFSTLAFGVKIPVPEVVQVPPLATVTIPFNETAEASAQIVLSGPLLTCGAGVIVITVKSETDEHPPLLVDVNVKLTLPDAISAAEGT